MSDSMSERTKTEIETIDSSRLREDVRIRIDAWIAAQPEPRPSRSVAIQRLLAEALAKEADGRAIFAENLNRTRFRRDLHHFNALSKQTVKPQSNDD